MRSRNPVALLIPLLVSLVLSPSVSQDTTGTRRSLDHPPLRSSEPAQEIVSDLESFIPAYMTEHSVPGVAISLVQGGSIVWSKGFGVTNAFTRDPVTNGTLFEVASHSKVVTAYLALRLVDKGLLALDEPLNGYLTEPWLPPSEYRDIISLRHVLSHTSGLGHNTLSRENIFPTGAEYSYSGIGLQYLQVVIEHVTGTSLEELANGMVFEPLGMSSSSFVDRADLAERTSNGHLRASVSTFLFAILFLTSLLVVGLVGLVVERIRTGHWWPGRTSGAIILIVAHGGSLVPLFLLFGSIGFLEFAWAIGLCGSASLGVFIGGVLLGRVGITRMRLQKRWQRVILMNAWGLLVLALLFWGVLSLTNIPIPRWTRVEPMASASLRTTADDLAVFLIELADPHGLSAEMAQEMRSSQVRLSDELSWGLGPGIQHGDDGDALWHWGQHIDFQSLTVIYPGRGFGVVVCTNNDLISPDVARDIAHRAVGGKIGPIRRGMRLEYNATGGGE